MKRLGAVLSLVVACGGARETQAPPFTATPFAEPVALGARRHPDEEPNAQEDRAPVVRQAKQARPRCACEQK